MITLRCDKCQKTFNSGKFCNTCGTVLKETYNQQVKFSPISTGRNSEKIKRDIKKWLARLGIVDVRINTADDSAEIQYSYKQMKYSFRSSNQDNISNNLAAVEQFLHSRVLGIERGIETIESAFAGYEALPDYSDEKNNFNPYFALGFSEKVGIETATKKFKELAKRYHPDLNPNKDTWKEFERVKRAIDMIEKEVQDGK